jgi:hypothetical protein
MDVILDKVFMSSLLVLVCCVIFIKIDGSNYSSHLYQKIVVVLGIGSLIAMILSLFLGIWV